MSLIKQKYSPLLISLFLIIIVMLTGCFNDINKETPNISRGLIAHYTFDEENGHIAKDSSEYDV
ncbi:MAG: hypothetical protein KGY65_08995, partial [Candidatus Thermoplasmatota archaeon]|nr:hypothetical protein [Candidatus Thermoplasmatota archaeon]